MMGAVTTREVCENCEACHITYNEREPFASCDRSHILQVTVHKIVGYAITAEPELTKSS